MFFASRILLLLLGQTILTTQLALNTINFLVALTLIEVYWRAPLNTIINLLDGKPVEGNISLITLMKCIFFNVFSFCVWAMVILCNPLSQICLGCKKESHYLSPTKIVFPRRKEAIRIVSVGYWMTILNVERMSVKSMQRTYVAFCIC